MIFNEFVLTTRPYIRTVTIVKPEWYVAFSPSGISPSLMFFIRLLEYATSYFDLNALPDGETKRALVAVYRKKTGKRKEVEGSSSRKTKKLKT